MPATLTSLVGREAEIAAACDRLAIESAVRLLTLTGPGGVGKTRLATAIADQLASEYPDGIAWVDLAAVQTPTAVALAIAQSLGMRDEGAGTRLDRVNASVGDRRILLVLDNFEHLLDAAPMIVGLLRTCPRLTMLVTSRERLRVNGEHEQPVSPLLLPSAEASREDVLRTPAVRLFVDRMHAVSPGLPLDGETASAVAKICRRLDGLPLAIELAAARVKVLPPTELLSRLNQRLLVLTDGPRDVPARLRTMRDAIAWSYDLLTPEEQSLFCRLAVFAGGFTIEAAEAVVSGEHRERQGTTRSQFPLTPHNEVSPIHLSSASSVLDLVGALVEKSLVVMHREPGGRTRYSMLEMIREFGLERLVADGELENACRSHAMFTLALASRIEPQLYGGRDLVRCLTMLEEEHVNLRAALNWLEYAGESTLALRLAASLLRFWMIHGHLSEGRSWLERVLANSPRAPAPLRAKALTGLALLAWPLHAQDQALAALSQAGTLVEETTDLTGLAFVRLSQGWIALDQGDVAAADTWANEAKGLYERLERRWDALLATRCLARVAHVQGELRRAESLYEELIDATQELGDDYGLATARLGLGMVRVDQGEHAQALALQSSALMGYQALGERMWVASCLEAVAATTGALGHAERAARLSGAAETVRTQTGLQTWFADRAASDETAVAARSALGEDAFAAAWAAGAAATFDEALTTVEATVEATSMSSPGGDDPVMAFGLSPREIEVLRLMAQGKTDQETAEALFVSRRTVHTHVASILNKLAAENRTAAVATAVRLGLA